MTCLSTDDLQRWALALSAVPKDPLRLIPWLVESVKPFFPFKWVLLFHGEHVAGEIRVLDILSHGHSQDYVEQFPRTFDLRTRGCLSWWMTHREPYCIDPAAPPPFASVYELEQIRRVGSGYVAVHGVVSPTASTGTFCSFAVPEPPGEWHRDALRLIAPMLNDLFLRYLAAQSAADTDLALLTPRQKDIVRLAVRGLSSKGIARELELSDKTVRNQLSSIYERLGVRDCRGMLASIR
jgi:DNA-binding CsgD family transcriptional regulator